MNLFICGLGIGACVMLALMLLMNWGDVSAVMAMEEMFAHHDSCKECFATGICCVVCKALWRAVRRELG